MLQRYILLWLIISSGLAWAWPRLGIPGPDPFLFLGASSISVMVVLAMFSVGAMLDPAEIDELRRSWTSVVFGTMVQYTCMPLLAWAAIGMLKPDAEVAAGIMIVGCVPGAMASNVLTLTARGNVSYSVSLTTLATLLSPVTVPFWLRLALGRDVEYDGTGVVRMLVLQIVLPVVAGHLLTRSSVVFRSGMSRLGPITANIAILTLIAVAVALKRQDVGSVSSGIAIPLLLINLFGYLGGYLAGLLARMDEGRRRALTLEVGMQNAGAGTALAIQLFGASSPATIPCVMYTFGCMLTGTILATAWHRSKAVDPQRDLIRG